MTTCCLSSIMCCYWRVVNSNWPCRDCPIWRVQGLIPSPVHIKHPISMVPKKVWKFPYLLPWFHLGALLNMNVKGLLNYYPTFFLLYNPIIPLFLMINPMMGSQKSHFQQFFLDLIPSQRRPMIWPLFLFRTRLRRKRRNDARASGRAYAPRSVRPSRSRMGTKNMVKACSGTQLPSGKLT